MRGGALPVLAWAGGLTLLAVLNWIWTGDAIQVASFGFAVLAMVSLGTFLIVRGGHEAHRPGPPEPDDAPEAVPLGSSGAVIAALGFALLIFGLAFGEFPILLGAAILCLALGRLAIELRAQRAARSRRRR